MSINQLNHIKQIIQSINVDFYNNLSSQN